LLALARGKMQGDMDLFLAYQEDAWERSARWLALLHNVNCSEKKDLKEPDHFNAWLDVPGVETEDAEKRRKEDEIIAERRRQTRVNNGNEPAID
jgi:hypothetical protein